MSNPRTSSLDDLFCNARTIWGRNRNRERAISTENREFRAHFGCGPTVCLTLWNLLDKTGYLPKGGRLEHLLWALLFMKMYSSQLVMRNLVGGVDDDTFRKWTDLFIEAIARLEPMVVSLYVLQSKLHRFKLFTH